MTHLAQSWCHFGFKITTHLARVMAQNTEEQFSKKWTPLEQNHCFFSRTGVFHFVTNAQTTPKMNPKMNPKMTPKMNPKMTPEINCKMNPEMSPETSPKMTLK